MNYRYVVWFLVSLWYYFTLVIIILTTSIQGITKCILRSGTIWTIFSVSGLPFPFYKMCVPSDLYPCYLQPLLSSPGWTPAKSASVGVSFFQLHCICHVIGVYCGVIWIHGGLFRWNWDFCLFVGCNFVDVPVFSFSKKTNFIQNCFLSRM